jgi:hypothetical protein
MTHSDLSRPCRAARIFLRVVVGFLAASVVHAVGLAAALPAPPQTFDTSYAAPAGATLTVAAGGDLQAALNKAQLGDTVVLPAGATFTGSFKLPNKTAGSGWIYVVSSNLASLPPPGQRVGPKDAINMPKIVARASTSALGTVPNSHHYRFVGIEFTPEPGAAVYQLISIGNSDALPATLAHHIVFDRCYVHGDPTANDRRGIEMDGAYVAVVDSYISDFQERGADSQGLWAYNTTGPLRIVDDYIEAAGENVMFGGKDSRTAALVPADIEIRNDYFFKPLSLIGSAFTTKNLLELKAAQRVLVTGNTFQNSPAGAQGGTAVVITPRNQDGSAPWSVTADIAIIGNSLINVGNGFGMLGRDNGHPSLPLTRLLIRDNVVRVTGLNGANGRAFQVVHGGSDITIDHNTVINTVAPPTGPYPTSSLYMADGSEKVTNFTFTNNLATNSARGLCGSGVSQGTAAINAYFTNWVVSKNVIAGAPADAYPAGNFFPATVDAVRFTNYANGDYTLRADSPYKSAATDGTDVGANLSVVPGVVLPNAPSNVVVK